MGRKKGASRLSSAGRDVSSDKRALELAQDALATSVFDSDRKLATKMRVAADQIKEALEAITKDKDRDGWADALGVLQGVIPDLERIQRELGAKSLQ